MKGMVVAPQVPAAEAGGRVLASGGNAIDAAVTAAFVQMIVDPQNCGIAGFGVSNIRTRDGETTVIDFNGTAGSRATPEMWQDRIIEQDWSGDVYHLEGKVNDVGYQSIMTPGTVAGLAETLSRFGTIGWDRALQPAIQVAEDGFVVPPSLWQLWNTPASGLSVSMLDRIQTTQPSREIYVKPDGTTPRPGERLRNPDYARSLRRLADSGPDDFYTGQLAEQMLADLERNGSFITADDLAKYRPRVEAPLSIDYRGHEVLTNNPAGGGICLAQILKILEHEDIAAMGLNSRDYISFVATAMKAGYHDWYAYTGDPAFVDVPVEQLISNEQAGQWIKRIRNGESFSVPRYPEPADTTHVTVVDGDGNVASITHSLGSSSGVVTPGLGFTYNNVMNRANPVPGKPNSIAPGKSRLTGMCPTIVQRGGQPVLALGAPGGSRIITGVLQGLLNVIDHGLRPQEAVTVARFDCQSDILDTEARIPTWVREDLQRDGFQINWNPASYGNFARVQAISIDAANGSLLGGSDPRGAAGAVVEIES